MTTNQIQLRNVKETERHNRATEGEDQRHNRVTEDYTSEHYERADQAALINAWAAASQADTAKQNAAINAINAETQRYVAETGRMSYAETARHNVATEELQAYQNFTNRKAQEETARHNKAGESISWSQLTETQRHNEAQEAIGRRQNTIADDKNKISWAYFGDQVEQEWRTNLQRDRELDIKEEANAIKREEIDKRWGNNGGNGGNIADLQDQLRGLTDPYSQFMDDDNGWWEQFKEFGSDAIGATTEVAHDISKYITTLGGLLD